jgi:hypothetical protein
LVDAEYRFISKSLLAEGLRSSRNNEKTPPKGVRKGAVWGAKFNADQHFIPHDWKNFS